MRQLNEFTDSELIERFEQHDIAAFEEIYNRYWLKLYSAAYKRLKEREPSKEIVQDLFTSLCGMSSMQNQNSNITSGLSFYVCTVFGIKL